MEVVSTLWVGHLTPPYQTSDEAHPAAPAVQTAAAAPSSPVTVASIPITTVLDFAIAALAPSATAIGPVPSTDSQSDEPASPAATSYHEGHRVIVESNAHGADHGRTKLAQQASSSARSKDHQEPLLTPPDGSLAIRFLGYRLKKSSCYQQKSLDQFPPPRLKR